MICYPNYFAYPTPSIARVNLQVFLKAVSRLKRNSGFNV